MAAQHLAIGTVLWLLTAACSNTTGGAPTAAASTPEGQGAEAQAAPADEKANKKALGSPSKAKAKAKDKAKDKDKDKVDAKARPNQKPDADADADADAEDEVPSGSGSVEAPEVAGNPRDEDVCDFAKSIPDLGKVAEEVDYLCANMKTLRDTSNGKMIQITDSQQGSLSNLSYAGAVAAPGTIAGTVKLADTFCRSFGDYKSLLGAAAFAEVESITPNNKTDSGCDFEFLGKAILFFQPQFRGVQHNYTNDAQTITVSANYLTERVSLVEDAVSLYVNVKADDKVISYTVQTSVSDTKGFHDQAKTKIVAGFETGFKAFAGALAKVGS